MTVTKLSLFLWFDLKIVISCIIATPSHRGASQGNSPWPAAVPTGFVNGILIIKDLLADAGDISLYNLSPYSELPNRRGAGMSHEPFPVAELNFVMAIQSGRMRGHQRDDVYWQPHALRLLHGHINIGY
jgi:hypothetical protein